VRRSSARHGKMPLHFEQLTAAGKKKRSARSPGTQLQETPDLEQGRDHRRARRPSVVILSRHPPHFGRVSTRSQEKVQDGYTDQRSCPHHDLMEGEQRLLVGFASKSSKVFSDISPAGTETVVVGMRGAGEWSGDFTGVLVDWGVR
jgi:hypothetical protein